MTFHSEADKGTVGGLRTPDAAPRSHGVLLHVLAIILVGLAVYSNTFESPFTFDDQMYVIDNPLIKDSGYLTDTARAAEHPYLEEVVRRYLATRWVAYSSFWLNYKLGGLDVPGYHAVNLTLHLANALLVYLLVVLTFKAPFLRGPRPGPRAGTIALFSGLLFVSHPVCTEGVTYVTQRFGQMATMFYLLSLVSYIGFRLGSGGKGRYGLYVASFASALLAMKSKETAFTLPLAIAMFEFMFLEGPKRRRLVFLAPLLSTMLLIPAEYLGMHGGGLMASLERGTRLQTDVSRTAYLFTELRVLATYMRLFFLPINQNVDYDCPLYGSLFDAPVMLSLALVSTVLALGVYAFRRSGETPELRLAAFGVFWFFLALSVESGLIPISERMFEYRMYLPMAGASAGVSAFLFSMSGRVGAGKHIVPLLIALVVLNAGAAYARNGIWGDERTLWGDAAKKSPNKARPNNNAGKAFMESGLVDEAVGYFRKAIAFMPGAAELRYNLGRAYLEKGMEDDARESLLKAVELDPDLVDARIMLGNLLLITGDARAAAEQYRLVLKLKPRYEKALFNLGVAHMDLREYEKAIEYYNRALVVNTGNGRVWHNLGVAYFSTGNWDEAIRCYRKAIEIDPRDAGSYARLAEALKSKGLLAEAVAALKRAGEVERETYAR